MAKKKKSKNWLIYTLVAVLLLVVVLAIASKNKGEKPTEVFAQEVKRKSIYETVGASGKIYPITEVKISSDVSGEIVELHVEEGDSVREGQVLARIDPEAFESQVEQARASVNNAKANAARSEAALLTSIAQKEQIDANLINQQKIHERNIGLHQSGVISDAEFDASLAALDALKANLRSAEATILSSEKSLEAANYSIQSAQAAFKELNTSLRRTTIKAPMSGIIASLSVELGERVVGTIQMTGTEMMRIANLNAMEVQVDVSESDILRVELQDSVEIEVDAYFDEKFYGRVTHIANSANSGSSLSATDQVTNFIVKVQIDPTSYEHLISNTKKYAFRPGMSAAVEIFTEFREDVLALPIQAVTIRDKEENKDKKSDSAKQRRSQRGNQSDDKAPSDNQNETIDKDEVNEVVFAIQSDTASLRIVKTGIQDDRHIEITSGVQLGDMVITGPYSVLSKTLESGDRVEKKNKEK